MVTDCLPRLLTERMIYGRITHTLEVKPANVTVRSGYHMSTIIRVFDVRILKLRNGFIVLTYPVHPDMVLSKPRIFGTLTVTVVCNLRLCDDSIINLLTLVIGHLVFIDVLVGVDECGTGGGVIVDTGTSGNRLYSRRPIFIIFTIIPPFFSILLNRLTA